MRRPPVRPGGGEVGDKSVLPGWTTGCPKLRGARARRYLSCGQPFMPGGRRRTFDGAPPNPTGPSMSDKISGSYPGGPRRPSNREGDAGPTRLETLEERADRDAFRRQARTGRRRRRRWVIGLGASMVVAGGVGFLLGHQATRESEELAAERQEAASRTGLEDMMHGEATRVIQQMWLSEIMEHPPTGPD